MAGEVAKRGVVPLLIFLAGTAVAAVAVEKGIGKLSNYICDAFRITKEEDRYLITMSLSFLSLIAVYKLSPQKDEHNSRSNYSEKHVQVPERPAPEAKVTPVNPLSPPSMGKISGDPGEILTRLRKAMRGDKGAEIELRTARYYSQNGKDVHMVKPMQTLGETPDFRIGGVNTEVKYVGGLGRNAAGSAAKGVSQVEPGGKVIIIRNSNAKSTLEQYKEFLENLNLKIRVLQLR